MKFTKTTTQVEYIAEHENKYSISISDKADKRAEIEKTERERQLQQEREDEMRELALKLRRR